MSVGPVLAGAICLVPKAFPVEFDHECQRGSLIVVSSAEPLRALGEITNAIETLTATQHELVNVLLDRGATWSTIAEALSTSSAGAKRRYPRRSARRLAAP